MRKILALQLLMLVATAAGGQERKGPDVKTLTPAECALITKRSDNEFYVKGPVTIGVATVTESDLRPGGVIINGVDNFAVVQRSCFSAK
jgi:hypothetical protein